MAEVAEISMGFGGNEKRYIIVFVRVTGIITKTAKTATSKSRITAKTAVYVRKIKSYSPLFLLIYRALETPLAEVVEVAEVRYNALKHWGNCQFTLGGKGCQL